MAWHGRGMVWHGMVGEMVWHGMVGEMVWHEMVGVRYGMSW